MTTHHHPLHTLGLEARHLRDVERRGEDAETPLLAMAGIALLVYPLLALVIGLAFGVAKLATGAAV